MADIARIRPPAVGRPADGRASLALAALVRRGTVSLLSFVALVMLPACGGGQQVRTTESSLDEGAEVTGEVIPPAEVDAGDAPGSKAAGRMPPHPDSVEPLGPNTRAALQDWSDGLRNAANRDRETEIVIRGYLAMARDVFARFRGSQSGPGKQGAYDPEPAWRFHLSATASLVDLAARAALLEELFKATAAAQAVDLEHPGPLGSRGERLQLYATLASCIREDTWIRAMHGAGLMRAFGSKPVPLERDEAAEMMRREIQMIRLTMKCTSLASRRRPPEPSGG